MTLRIIGGLFKGRILKTPKSSSTRPTQGMLREALFNICQNEIEGALFLDLFAGSGAIGLEALSRGALHVTFVEQNREAICAIKENIEFLHVENQTQIIPTTATRAIGALRKQASLFDLIYMDPPYDTPLSSSFGIDLSLIAPLLKPSGALFLETRSPIKEPIPGLQLQNSRKYGIAILSTFKPTGI